MKRVVLCLSAAVLAIVGLGRAAAEHTSDPAAVDTEPVVDKEQLFSDLDSMTEGTQVWLQDVVVREKTGNVLRIADRRHRLFVVPLDPSALDFLAIGAHVDVRGTLRKTPSAAQARLIYAMSPAAAWRLAHDRLYVDAWSVVSS